MKLYGGDGTMVGNSHLDRLAFDNPAWYFGVIGGMEDGSTLNRLGGYRSVCTIKPVLLVLTVYIFLTVTLLAGILAFVAELVLLSILKLLVELPCLCPSTLAPAAFLMQLRTQGQTSVLLKSPCNPTYSCSGFNINILTV